MKGPILAPKSHAKCIRSHPIHPGPAPSPRPHPQPSQSLINASPQPPKPGGCSQCSPPVPPPRLFLPPLPPGQVEYDGLTGRVEFNSKGQRTNYTLRVLEKAPDGHREVRPPPGPLNFPRLPWTLETTPGGPQALPPQPVPPPPPQVGVWYSNRTLAMNATSLALDAPDTLANKTLVVTTILVSPGGGGERGVGQSRRQVHNLGALLVGSSQAQVVVRGKLATSGQCCGGAHSLRAPLVESSQPQGTTAGELTASGHC